MRNGQRRVVIAIIAILLIAVPTLARALLDPMSDALLAGHYEEVIRIGERQIPDISKASTSKLYPLCLAYLQVRRYNKLLPCIDQLDRNIAMGDKTYSEFKIYVGYIASQLRTEALIDLGDYAGALTAAKQLAAESNKLSANMSNIVTWYLPFVYALRGERVAAQNALAVMGPPPPPQTADEENKPVMVQSYLNGRRHAFATIYTALGDYENALPLWKSVSEADAHAESIAGKYVKYLSSLRNRFMLAKCYIETNQFTEAKKGLDSLLRIKELAENGAIYWLVLFSRGYVAEREGDLKGATDYYRKAVDVIEMQRSTINTETRKIGFVGDKQAVYRNLVSVLFQDGQYDTAFEYVERSKSRALVDMLASKQNFSVMSGDPEKVKNLLTMADDAESKAMLQDVEGDKSHTRNLVVRARQQLSTESPELASLVNVTSLAAAEIKKMVPQDESLVEYYYNAPDFMAFILSTKGLDAVRLGGADLQENVRQFRQEIENPNSKDYVKLSRQLYDQLFRPIAGRIDTQKLIIVAHGPLHYLPFNALNDGHSYLIDHYSVRMLPSASVLKYLHPEAVSKPGNILAFGNPDLGNPAYDLVHAQEEAVAVTKGKEQSKVLLRKEASETALRQFGGEFRYLHFATHGQFNADAPLKSALLLSGDGQNDGMLTVDKLYSMKLDADLVTLSACETGLGKIANGDDVVGLTRGFLYAGSRTIVASLWQVDDLATSYLMTHFYDGLQQNDKREALRKAQLDTRQKFPHPYYWAAFQLTGKP